MCSSIISILVPIYNAVHYLPQCVASLATQSSSDKEVILVDDGSTDGSGALCDEYAARYSFVRVVHQENQGVSAARNVGLSIARGEWVAFVDADDWVDSDMLARLQGYVLAVPADMYRWGAVLHRSDGRALWRMRPVAQPTITTFADEEQQCRFYARRHTLSRDILQTLWGGLYRRDIIQENALAFVDRDAVVFEDTLFNYHYFLHTRKIVFLPDMPYHYRRHDTSYCATRRVEECVLCSATLGEHAYRAVVEQGLTYFREHFHHHYFLFLNTVVHTAAHHLSDRHLRQLFDRLWQNPLHRKCIEKIRQESDLFINDTRSRVWYDEQFGIEQ